MPQPNDHDLIARALSAWYRTSPISDLSAEASTVVDIDGLRYVVLRSTTRGTVAAVYRVIPANLTTPIRLRLMKRPPTAVLSAA